MNLTLAAAILAKSSKTVASPSSSDHALIKDALLVSKDRPFWGWGGMEGGHDGAARLDMVGKIEDSISFSNIFPKSFPASSSIKRSLKNSHHHKTEVVECEPQIAESSVPDEGILSCGPGQYCLESVESALGGICIKALENSNRGLQEIVDYVEGFCSSPDLTCSVCNADRTSYSAAFDCKSPEGCTSQPGLCSDGRTYYFCSYLQYVANYDRFDATGTILYFQNCFHMSTAPSPALACLKQVTTLENGISCSMSVRGEDCTSCEFDAANSCFIYNCENTAYPISGNSCYNALFNSTITAYLEAKICPEGSPSVAPGPVGTPSPVASPSMAPTEESSSVTDIFDVIEDECTRDDRTCTVCYADRTNNVARSDCNFEEECISGPICESGEVYDFCGILNRKAYYTTVGPTFTTDLCWRMTRAPFASACLQININSYGASCSMSIQDQACTSCVINEEYCEIFDCQNTAYPISGNYCTDGFIYPMIVAFANKTKTCDDTEGPSASPNMAQSSGRSFVSLLTWLIGAAHFWFELMDPGTSPLSLN